MAEPKDPLTGNFIPPSLIGNDPLLAQAEQEDKAAAEKAVGMDQPEMAVTPYKSGQSSVSLRPSTPTYAQRSSVDLDREAYNVAVRSVLGERSKEMSEADLRRQVQDTPSWTAAKSAAAARAREDFARIRKDPLSTEYRLLSDPTYMRQKGESLHSEAEVAERENKRHEWYEANIKFNPVNAAAYIQYAELDGGSEMARLRKMLKPSMTWGEAGAVLKEGVTMWAMNTDFNTKKFGKIKAINRFKGPLETFIQGAETHTQELTKAKKGFAGVINAVKNGKGYDQSKVTRILEMDAKNPDFYQGGGKADPAYFRMVKELTAAEQAAVILGLEHKVVPDGKGGVRPFREATDDPASARPMSFTDFDLNMVSDSGLDEADVVANIDYAYMGMGSSNQGAGYALAQLQFNRYAEKNARRSSRLASNKIDPARWFSDNLGKGLLVNVTPYQEAHMKTLAGAAYNSFISPWEQTVTSGVKDFFTPFVYNHRPDSFWWDVKNFVAGNSTLEEKIAFLDASMEADKYSTDAMAGKYTSAADTIVGMVASNETQQKIRIGMQRWGFATEGTGTYGTLRWDPAMAAGKVANIGGSNIRGIGVIRKGVEAGIISEKTVSAVVKGVEVTQDYLLSAPVKAAGYVVGKAGRMVAYVPAIMAEGAVRLTTKMLKAAAVLDSGYTADKAVRRMFYTLGFTDAFFMGGWSSRLAFTWGVGKAADVSGHLVGKYFDFRMDGYGFRGAMSHAANNSSLGTLAQSTAKVLAEGGMFTKTAWDTAKGVYAGVGVGFSMGWMNGDAMDGINAAIQGAGMAGAGSVHAGGVNYISGRTHHDAARKLLEEQAKNMDDETRQRLVQRMDEAEFEADYEFAPRLISAVEKLTKLGVKTVIATRRALSNNPMLRAADLMALDDADMTVTVGNTTRTFDIRGKQQVIYDIRQKMDIARAAGEMNTLRQLKEQLNSAESDKIKEVNEYLEAVRKSGNSELIKKVGSGQLFNGVYKVDDDGNQFVFLNIDDMDSTTSSHETFHAIQKLIGRTTSARHFASVVLGIKFGQTAPDGTRGETVFQKGLFDAEDLMEYGSSYYRRLFGDNTAAAEQKISELKSAVDEMKLLGERGILSESSHRIIKDAAEELGAEWFENFVKRKPQDLLYFGGKYGKMRQLSDRMVMYIRHNTSIDANAAGIKANLRKNNQELQKHFAERERLRKVRDQVLQFRIKNEQAISALMKSEGISYERAKQMLIKRDPTFKKTDEIVGKWENDMKEASYFGQSDIFTTKDGTHLIVEEVDKYFQDILAAESDKPITIELSLASMSGSMLQGHLASLGLEHYGYTDSSGVHRLKDKKQIDAEEAARGKRTIDVLSTLPPERTGMVRTTDANGNIRLVGELTDEALNILLGDTYELNGHTHQTLPMGVAIKLRTMRDAIQSTVNASNTDFNVQQFLYSGLSKENEEGPRTRKPHGVVEQTYRRVVPYRMEAVMTTKDRNGNKVEPHFEFMVTAIDLGVIYKRMANEFNASYRLPSGKVITVSDIFGGDMSVFHEMFQVYLHNMSKSVDAQPSAEVFGGGERGAAIRDIMYRVLGTIPQGGHDFTGKPLAYNNPIIRPFDTWDRGPDFPFTTFRVDLMSHLEQIPERITFNEEYGYSRGIGNYQPPSLARSSTLRDGSSQLHEYEGDIDSTVKSKKNVPVKYQVLEGGGKFIVSSEQLIAPLTFKTKKQAENFINLDYQRASAVYNSAKNMPINYEMKGIVVGSFGGKYMLLDNFGNAGRKLKVLSNTTFSTFQEAMKAAAVLHNKTALESVNNNADLDERAKALLRNQINVISAASNGEDAMIPRVDIDEDGNVSFKPVTKEVDGEKIPVVYEADDAEVVNGLVKAGDQKYAVKVQKVPYNLTKLLTGKKSLYEKHKTLKNAGQKLGNHLVDFMLENLNDPEVMKGFKWYMDFSERGYKVFGPMFPMMCEALGATSARTPVEPNFKQAAEFVRKFSLGHYDAKIKVIVQRLDELHARIEAAAPEGQRYNQWWLERVGDKVLENVLKRKGFNESIGLPVKMSAAQYRKALPNIPAEIRQRVDAAIADSINNPKYKGLSDDAQQAQIREAEMEILQMEDTILLRDEDKKFNMNSHKVTMVALSHFFSKSQGPKTPQFARNLMGVNFEATIDVWAARTLHRIINTVMLKNNKNWRILPSMEMPVSGKIVRKGTAAMPVITGEGDFYLGQEAFRHAVEILKSQHGDKFEGFKTLNPANLQALLWFAEKKLYERNGWTSTVGAEKSSFEGPLDRMFGKEDPEGIEGGSSVRRIMFGVSMANDTNRDIVYAINDKGQKIELKVPVRYRMAPAPLSITRDIARSIVEEHGSNVVGLIVTPSTGGYGSGLEDNVYIHVSMERGSQIKLANSLNEAQRALANAEALVLKYATEKNSAKTQEEASAIEGKIAQKKKEMVGLRNDVDTATKELAGDISTSRLGNQLPSLTDMVIQLGKKYQQSDVLAHEVVGKNHPNARPMRTVQFNRSINGFEAEMMMRRFNREGQPSLAFTMEPDPRNPNVERIDRLSKDIQKLEVEYRKAKTEAAREDITKKISELKSSIMGLQRFQSMYTVAVPEFAWKFGKDAGESVRDWEGRLNEKWAREFMGQWEAHFDTMLGEMNGFLADGGKSAHAEWKKRLADRKGVKDEKDPEPETASFRISQTMTDHVNTIAVSSSGYDYFDISQMGANATLESHIQRYKDETTRERETRTAVNDSREVVSPNVTPAGDIAGGLRRSTTGEQDVQRSGPEGRVGTVQGKTGLADGGRLPSGQAREWLNTRKAKAARTEAGLLYGDGDISVLQVADAKGSLTNEFRVNERGGTFVKFKSKKDAEAYVMGRLTGSVPPKHEPRKVSFGGKLYDMVAGVNAIPAQDTALGPLKTDANRGIFAPDEDIFGFDIKVKDENFQPVRVTPEEDAEYLRAVADGDMDKARKMVMVALKKSEYRGTYYRGTRRDERKKWKYLLKDTSGSGDPRNANVWAFASKQNAIGWAGGKEDKVLKLAVRGDLFNPNDDQHVAKLQPMIDEKLRVLKIKLQDVEDGNDGLLGTRERIKELKDEIRDWESAWSGIQKSGHYGYYEGLGKDFTRMLEKAGFTGYREQEGTKTLIPDTGTAQVGSAAIIKASNVKLMDPVTYDEMGNVVPLSKRFDPTKDDINYQPRRFEPRRVKHQFGTKNFGEVFPAGRNADRQVLFPSEAYSDRVEQQLTAFQETIDATIGPNKLVVTVELHNTGGGNSFSGEMRIVLRPVEHLANVKSSPTSGRVLGAPLDGIVLAKVDASYALSGDPRNPNRGSGGYVHYGNAITEDTTARTLDNGKDIVDYTDVVRGLAHRIKYNFALQYNADGTPKFKVTEDDAKKIEALTGFPEYGSRAEKQAAQEAFSQSPVLDIFKGLGSLAYQEIAARLHAAGTNRRQDTAVGLKGGVVNETGALFGARERAFKKGNTDYRLNDGDVFYALRAVERAHRNSGMAPHTITMVMARFLADGTLPQKMEDYIAKQDANNPNANLDTIKDANRVLEARTLMGSGTGALELYKASGFQYGTDFSLTTSGGKQALFTQNRKVAEWFRSMETGIDTRSFTVEGQAYQAINWSKYRGVQGHSDKYYGYSRHTGVGHPVVTTLYSNEIVWPEYFNGDRGDELVLGMFINKYGKSMGEDHAIAAKGLFEMTKRLTGKNYSTLVVDLIKSLKAGKVYSDTDHSKWALSGSGTAKAGEIAQTLVQTAVLQKLVSWLRSQKGETNAQRTMTKEFDPQAPQNSIEGIGGAHHGKVRATFEELAKELERAFMRTKEEMLGNAERFSVEKLSESSIANAYLTTAIREALVAKFEADGIPYDQYKTILEDVFGYLLNEQRATRYSRGKSEDELLRKLNFQRSMPAVRMASPEVADIITFMLSAHSINTRMDSRVPFDADVLRKTGDIVQASKYNEDTPKPNDEKAIKHLLGVTMGFKGAELDEAYNAIIAGRWQNLFSTTTITQKEAMEDKVRINAPFSGTSKSHEQFKSDVGFDVRTDATSVRQMSNSVRGLMADPEQVDALTYTTTDYDAFIRQSANIFNRQLEDLNELLRYTMGTDANQSGETARTVGEETALRKNGDYLGVIKEYTSLKELKADIKRLQELKKRAIAAYEGKDASEVSLKAKPYKQVISERIAKGELVGIDSLFAELRNYGIKRISIREMIELTKMATESREIDLGAESNAAKFSEQKDFQLLMFLDAISGLQYDTDSNQVGVIEEGKRGWSFDSRGQFGAGKSRGDYILRTDGDMRTILEEFHHQLVQNNETYRTLYQLGAMQQKTGAAWKKHFMQGVEIIEQGLRSDLGNAAKKFGDTPDGIANSERAASKAIGSMALCTLARLWVGSFDTDRRNFGLNQQVQGRELGLSTDSPASDILFSDVEPRPSKRLAPSDKTFTSMDKFYHGGMEKDYHFKSLIEFAAGAMNDSHVQSVLAQQKPIVDENGREPMQGIIDDMQVLGNKTMIAYANRFEKVMSKAKNLLEQLVGVIKTMIQFQQTSNHSTQGTDFARIRVASKEQEIRSKRTALEQALEASASVMPRHKGTANELPYKGDVNSLGKTGRARYEATSGDFREGLLDQYLGRVRGTFKPESK